MTHSQNLEDLIQAVASDTTLPKEQAEAAVASTLRYLSARLPSPLVGQLLEQLQATPGRFSGTDNTAKADLKTK